MILRFVYILIFFLASVSGSWGQCKESLHSINTSSKYIRVYRTIECPELKRNDKRSFDITPYYEELTKQLKVALATTISSKVSTITSHSVQEVNKNFSEQFLSNTNVQSQMQFGVLIPDTCFDSNKRVLHGILSVVESDIAIDLANYCLADMGRLHADLSGKVSSKIKNVDLNLIQDKIEELVGNYTAAVLMKLDLKEWGKQGDWIELLESVSKLKSIIESDDAQNRRKEDLQKANQLAQKNNFKEALDVLNRLIVYHSDREVLDMKEKVQADYKYYAISKIEMLVAGKSFDEAIQIMNEFCFKVPCDKAFIDKRKSIEKEYFEYSFDLFQTHIKYKDKPNIEKFKSILDGLSSVDIERYSSVRDKYVDFKVDEGKEQIMNHWDARRFNEAYSTLIKLENTYGVQKADLSRYKSKLKNRLYRIEAHGVKASRPKVYSFWLGSDVFANEVVFDSINTFAVNQYYFAYSGGLYRKIRIAEEPGKRGYPVRSDFIGFKFRMRDYRSTTSYFISDSIAALNKPVQSFDYDIALDGIASRVIHYSVGLNVNDKFEWDKPNFYFLTVGLRVPISNLSFITDITGQTLFDSHSSLLISAGLHLRLDYKRKFNLSDKRSVRTRLY